MVTPTQTFRQLDWRELFLRVASVFAGAVFLLAAVAKSPQVITAIAGPELTSHLSHGYGVLTLLGELVLGIALVVRPMSLIVNAVGAIALLCIIAFHSLRHFAHVSGSCGCFGAWSPPSWLIVLIASVCAAIFCTCGPVARKLVAFRSEKNGRKLMDSIICTHSFAAIASVFVICFGGMVTYGFLGKRGAWQYSLATVRPAVVMEDDGLKRFLAQLASSGQLKPNGSLLFVRSSCGHCQQLLDQIAIAFKHGVPPDVARGLLVVDLDGKRSTAALPLGIGVHALDQPETISTPTLPLLCQLSDGEVTSVRAAVSADAVLSSLAALALVPLFEDANSKE